MENDDFIVLDKEDIQDFNEENLLPQSPASRTSILAWLDPTKYDEDGGEFKKHLYAHTAGTNEWILGLNTWKDWYESTTLGLLWIKGIPGSGKSVAAANLVQRLERENENAAVLYFFFRQIIDANHSPESCIRDWLAQTLPYSPALQAELSRYVKESRDLSTFSREDLWKLLRLGLVHQKKAFIVADALDEMDSGNEDFINELAQLSQWRPSDVKILLTSRPTNAMENAFRSTDVLQIRLEEKHVDTDISTFVSSCLKSTSISAEDQTSIRQAIPGHANGLFLYARLAMDALLKPGIVVRETLDKIPINLNSMFDSLLHEHANRSGVSLEFQMAVLQWVTHATRPLRLLELSEILHNVHGKSYGYSLKDVKMLVRSSCGPLIEVLPDESLSVVHHSLTEFLKGWTRESMPLSSDGYIFPVFEPGPTNLILARACLHYLQWANLNTSKEKVSKGAYDLGSEYDRTLYDPARGIRLDRPFATYSASSWNIHVTRALAGAVSDKDAEEIHKIIDIIFADVLKHKALQNLLFSSKKLEDCSAIHLAAKIGLAEYARRILERNPSLRDSRDAKNRTPLHFAAEMGHSDTVKVLLQHGADPDPDQAHGYKPIHHAAKRNHHETVRLLLEAGVDPLTEKTRETPGRRCGNAPRTKGQTPLMYACDFGHLDALNAFIPFLKPDAVVKALAWSAKSGRTALIRQILFRTGVKVDALHHSASALYLACCGHHFGAITLLLDAGADPNLNCTGADGEFRGGFRAVHPMPHPKLRRRKTPLQAFVSLMYRPGDVGETLTEFLANVKAVLGRLISAGGDVNVQDYQGNSPLHLAIQIPGSDEIALSIIEVLVDAGCDVNMANDKGELPLHKCLNDQTGKILRLLIEKGGADINQKDANGRTPLIAILEHISYSPATILQILAFQPDLAVTDSHGNSALHLVAKKSRYVHDRPHEDSDADPDEEVMDALIASGVNPNCKNDDGKTPLHLFQFSPQFHKTLWQDARLIEKLIKAGADLEAKDWHGRTVLFSQVSKSKKEIQVFIDAGCRVDARDNYGRSLLHGCMKENHRGGNEQDILRMLLSQGLNPNLLDYDGNTLFHELAVHEHEVRHRNLLSFLKPLVSPDQANYAGQTPLHIATSYAPCYGSGPPLFDALLDICEHKDIADANLVTPLHIAASISDRYVKKLLNSGADATAVTKNGFTVLHLASRARQSNTIGVLCEHLTKTDRNGAKRLIDARDDAGRTALHYASRSGRLESVELLLQYGADPSIRDSEDKTALEACVGFEEEQIYWKTWPVRNTWGRHVRINKAKFGDDHWLKPDKIDRLNYDRRHIQDDHDTVRLEEIIEVLMTHSPYASFGKDQWQVTLEPILMKAVERNYEYTYHCFLHLVNRLGLSESMQAASYGSLWEQQRQTFEQKVQWNGAEPPTDEMISFMVSDSLYCRRFDLVRKFIKSADRRALLVCQDIFVRWGYSALLSESLDYSSTLPEVENLDIETDKVLNQKLLLIKACQRDLPNVAALQTIIDHKACSINEHFDDHSNEREGTALYALARGVEWWQVEQGLPCLLDAGADINLISDDGDSALHSAFAYNISKPYRRLKYPERSYGDRAAEVLIERGADVNILTVSGQPYLALTDNLDLISLLLKRGAQRSISALFGAVVRGKPETLRTLLSAGIDPNRTVVRIRKETNHRVDWETDRIGWISDDHGSEYRRGLEEESPLHYATNLKNHYWAWRRNEPCESDADLELIRTFIEHGADPTLRLTRRPPKNDSGLDLGLGDGDGPISTTLIHSVMYEGGCTGPLLDISGLDLEMRDSKDRTLFLAACCEIQPMLRGSSVFAEAGMDNARDNSLLENLHARGADIRARDIGGNNALHLLFGHETFDGDAEGMIKKLIKTEPGLINQPNSMNLTPFHFALRFRSHHNDFVNAMIDAGADVTLPDNAGNNILHYMGRIDEFLDFDLLRRLLSKGVDINSRNLKGETMLHLHLANRAWNMHSARPYHGERDEDYVDKVMECFASLIDAGADVFAKTKAGDTMLHIIAVGFSGETKKGSPAVRCFRFFMDLGLDPLAENEGQSTSLDVAAANENVAILEMFQKDGVVEEDGGTKGDERVNEDEERLRMEKVGEQMRMMMMMNG